MARIVIDADACPVKDEAIAAGARRGLPVLLVANFHHLMPAQSGVETIVVGDDPDEADFKIANVARRGDIVVTADYPLAALALGKGARALSPRGLVYTDDNILSLLDERARTQEKLRRGKRPKGPKPFRPADRARFAAALEGLIRAAHSETMETGGA